MTTVEAAKLLDVPADATSDQIEARFLDLRRRLEDKIAKAPTPGLQAKYRESLTEITTAFETLALAADSSALPVLKREKGEGSGEKGRAAEAGDRSPEAGAAVTPPRASDSGLPSPASGLPPAKRAKSGGMEFIVVAIVAVAVLGAGGWWVVKTRAENAEKARIAAIEKAETEAKAAAEKAEAERKAAEEKRIAEEKRLAEEAEKARIAAAEKAEQERVERLLVSVRLQLAELKLAWEELERQEREAARQVTDLKTELRDAREAAAGKREELNARLEASQSYHDWLQDFLARHPARRLRVRAEELLAARLADEAVAEVKNLQASLEGVPREMSARQRRLEASLYGGVRLTFANSIDRWSLRDAFGGLFNGGAQPAAELPKVARGVATVTLWRGEVAREFSVTVPPERLAEASLRFPEASLRITANVSGAEAWQEGRLLGKLPLELSGLLPGLFQVEVRAVDHVARVEKVELMAEGSSKLAVVLEPRVPTEEEIIQKFTQQAAGVWIRRGQGLPGTGFVRIESGSAIVVSKGKYMGMTHVANSRLRVPDPRSGEVRLVDAASGQDLNSVISYVDGQVLFISPGLTQRLVRGSPSDW